MKIVAFTEMRPDEMSGPLEAMSGEATVVSVASRDGLFARLLSAARDGRRAIKTQSPDAIVVYNGVGPLGFLCVLFSAYYSVPLLIRLNGDIRRQHREKISEYRNDGNWSIWMRYWLYFLLTQITFGYASGYITVSRELKETLQRQLGCRESEIQVASGPVRPAAYRSESDRTLRELGIDADRVLLTVTNLNYHGKYRGVRQILDEVIPLLERHEDVAYVIAGDGRYHEQLIEDLEGLPNESVRRRISAPGYVDEVPELYAGADIFVYVSHIDGYPNVVLEAQSAGLPVVANPAHGMPEQITDGESGLLVDPSRGDLGRVLEELLDDPDRCRDLGRGAATKVERANRPKHIGRELQRAIERILTE